MDAGQVDEANDEDVPAKEEETTPKPAPRRIAVETSSPVPDSDDVKPANGMEGVEEAAREDVQEEADDEDEVWKPEDKDLVSSPFSPWHRFLQLILAFIILYQLLAVLFNHQISPLSPFSVLPTQTQLSAPSPSTPSTLSSRNATFQALLAPLEPQGSATARDRTEHQRSSNRIMGALSGALKPTLSAGDVVVEVLKGLQAMAKLFERLNMVRPPSLLCSVSCADDIVLRLIGPFSYTNSSAHSLARSPHSSHRSSPPPPAVPHVSHLKHQRPTLPRRSVHERESFCLERGLCREVGEDRGDEGNAERSRGRGLASRRASGRRRVRLSSQLHFRSTRRHPSVFQIGEPCPAAQSPVRTAQPLCSAARGPGADGSNLAATLLLSVQALSYPFLTPS